MATETEIEAVQGVIAKFFTAWMTKEDRQIVADEITAALDRVRAEDRDAPHDAYVEPLDGGHRGYQARCWVCDWTGPEHLRGDETLGTWASRAHKAAAQTDAAEHRAEFSDGATADGKGNDA